MPRGIPFTTLVLGISLVSGSAFGQGLYVGGSGPIGRSMAGATTAAPVDAASALFWNPASMTGMEHSEVMFGGEMLYADTHLFSSVTNPAPLSGNTRSDSGLAVLSGLAFVRRIEDSRLSYGLAMPTIAGGSVNFPGSGLNPVVAPTGPLGNVVLGPIASNALIVQLAPSLAYEVTEKLSVGFAPTVDVALVSFDPAYFARPDDANGDGLFTFPTASHSRPFWGGGFKVGAFYHLTPNIDTGFSYISPQWFETWTFNARNEIGQARTLNLQATLPAIYSWGVAYKGIERLLLSLDLRLFDYANSTLFGTPLVDGGLGWSNVFAVAWGAQYGLTERTTVRIGYLYNQNPLPPVGTFFNAQLPALIQHTVSAGLTYNLTDALSLSLAYVHGFEATSQGSALQAAGVNVGLSSEYDSVVFGMNFKFGGPEGRPVATYANVEPTVISEPASANPPATPESAPASPADGELRTR